MSNAKLRIEDGKVQLEFVSAFNDEVQLSMSPEEAIQTGSLMAEYGKALLAKRVTQEQPVSGYHECE